MCIGKLFHSMGAIIEKARSPYLVMVRVPGQSWRWEVEEERKRLVDEDVDVERRDTSS